MQEQPITPDADACAYCHAPAAGTCADCGALCCGDCVDIVLRFTSRRAVCHACLATGATPAARHRPWLVAAALLGAAACVILCA